MDVNAYGINEVSPDLLSKVTHALGLEDLVPRNDRVYPINVWEALIESVGRARNCSAGIIERAKSRYTYYMLYHYAPGI
jgi:hypothetical protein